MSPEGFSQCLWNSSVVICWTQSSQPSLSYCLQRGLSLQKFWFPTLMLLNLESSTPLIHTDNVKKDLGIMSKMIWNLTLINPYLLEGWNFPFPKEDNKPNFFLEVQVSWKASCKMILTVQTPVHSAPFWPSANMKIQIINTTKINQRTCWERIKFARPNPLQSFFVPRDILCFTK